MKPNQEMSLMIGITAVAVLLAIIALISIFVIKGGGGDSGDDDDGKVTDDKEELNAYDLQGLMCHVSEATKKFMECMQVRDNQPNLLEDDKIDKDYIPY